MWIPVIHCLWQRQCFTIANDGFSRVSKMRIAPSP